MTGSQTVKQLLTKQANATYKTRLHLCVDAKSVYDIVCNVREAKPAEEHLILHVMALREMISTVVIEAIWWIDTRDMPADGRTKGVVLGDEIIAVVEKNEWKIEHECVRWPKEGQGTAEFKTKTAEPQP